MDHAKEHHCRRAGEFSKPSERELSERLSPLVPGDQKEGTEPPFDNAYWNNKGPASMSMWSAANPCSRPLTKFDSGTGWPVFTRPLDSAMVVRAHGLQTDTARTEVRSRHADSHLGHVFDDGPAPTGRVTASNSAALRFSCQGQTRAGRLHNTSGCSVTRDHGIASRLSPVLIVEYRHR